MSSCLDACRCKTWNISVIIKIHISIYFPLVIGIWLLIFMFADLVNRCGKIIFLLCKRTMIKNRYASSADTFCQSILYLYIYWKLNYCSSPVISNDSPLSILDVALWIFPNETVISIYFVVYTINILIISKCIEFFPLEQ